ncbi:MAG TPA: AAA family ATPase [Gemmataceae bacterium]|nr:AAA family ATPase [Gemmataceae bacterium]
MFSEEPRSSWEERRRHLHIAEGHWYFCQPFAGRPTMNQWRALIAAMLELRRREGLAMLVIDPIGLFLPCNENTAAAVLDCLRPLRELTAAGLSVVLIHHPRKGPALPGQAARGTGAFGGFVDIALEMHWYDKREQVDRRRWLRAYSRHEETPRNLVVELTAAGDDYVVHDGADDPACVEGWQALCLVLQDASERLTQRQILEQWPDDFPRPDQATVSRALKRGMDKGLVHQQGSGRKNDPFRYWLPDKEDAFYPGDRATPEQLERFDIYHRAKFFEALGDDPETARKKAAAWLKSNPQAAPPPAAPADPALPEPPVAKASPAPTEPPCARSATPVAATPAPEAVPSPPLPAPPPAPAPEAAPPKRPPRKRIKKQTAQAAPPESPENAPPAPVEESAGSDQASAPIPAATDSGPSSAPAPDPPAASASAPASPPPTAKPDAMSTCRYGMRRWPR